MLWFSRGREILREKVAFVLDLEGWVGAQWTEREGVMGIPDRKPRPSKNENTWTCKAWLGNSEQWCGAQHRGLGRRRGQKAICEEPSGRHKTFEWGKSSPGCPAEMSFYSSLLSSRCPPMPLCRVPSFISPFVHKTFPVHSPPSPPRLR